MKKIFLLILSVLLLFSLSACNNSDTSSGDSKNDLAFKYYEYAQSCIAENDTEKAKEVLIEGIDKTKSSILTDLLSEIEKGKSGEKNITSENTSTHEYGKISGLDFSYWNNSDFNNSSNPAAGLTFSEVNDIYLMFSIGVDDGSEYMYQQEIDLRDCQAKWKGHYNDGKAEYTIKDLTLTLTFNKDGTLNISESGTSPYSTSLAGLYKRS